MIVSLELPYPPSINHYWRHWRGHVVISKQGREYRDFVGMICRKKKPFADTDKLSVYARVHCPDNRRRDLDNTLKALLDAVANALDFDDSQIDELHVQREQPIAGGRVVLNIQTCDAFREISEIGNKPPETDKPEGGGSNRA